VEAGFDTSDVIAEYCGISQSCASTLLAHYWRQGLLHRNTGPLNNEKIYDLSERGYESARAGVPEKFFKMHQ
jgi:hypothetical protein